MVILILWPTEGQRQARKARGQGLPGPGSSVKLGIVRAMTWKIGQFHLIKRKKLKEKQCAVQVFPDPCSKL